jgi:hypothetical protein
LSPDFDELAQAIANHYPRTALWKLQARHDRKRLVPVVDPAAGKAAAQTSAQTNGQATVQPANDGYPPAGDPASVLTEIRNGSPTPPGGLEKVGSREQAGEVEPATVTAEELAMLLGRPPSESK